MDIHQAPACITTYTLPNKLDQISRARVLSGRGLGYARACPAQLGRIRYGGVVLPARDRCDELCTKHDGLCIKDDEFCIKMMDFVMKMMDYVLKMMNFVELVGAAAAVELELPGDLAQAVSVP